MNFPSCIFFSFSLLLPFSLILLFSFFMHIFLVCYHVNDDRYITLLRHVPPKKLLETPSTAGNFGSMKLIFSLMKVSIVVSEVWTLSNAWEYMVLTTRLPLHLPSRMKLLVISLYIFLRYAHRASLALSMWIFNGGWTFCLSLYKSLRALQYCILLTATSS